MWEENEEVHAAILKNPELLAEVDSIEKAIVQLTAATKQFLSDTKRNEIKENSLKLSKIFKWFDKDFEQKIKDTFGI